MRTCSNCKFAGRNSEGRAAYCAMKPPLALNTTQSTFPVIVPVWKCGEHKLSLWRLVKRVFTRK